MEWITKKEQNGTTVLSFHGRVDSANAPEVEAQINALRAGTGNDLILDAEELQYISSAGLRIVLRLRKECPTLKVINASSEVYDIFEMTGFTEMIPVEKGYRHVSVDGCEAIGRGANGLVYRLDPDTIIKVYLNPDSLDDIRRERELARRAFVLGVPTAIPYDVVKVGNSYGSVFELLNAKSFAKLLNDPNPDLDKIASMYVDLLKKIHSTDVLPTDMPEAKPFYSGYVEELKNYLPADRWQKLSDMIAAIPNPDRMIHGDCHVKNAMLQNGEALLIDMDTLSRGDPVLEFAGIFNAYIGHALVEPGIPSEFLGIPAEVIPAFWNKTVSLYFGLPEGEKLQRIKDKIALVGYMRLLARTIRRNGVESEKGKLYYTSYRDVVCDLIDKLDDVNLFAE